ncbi:TIGR02300 family protein [Benzoatithermus flavus]|uniref:TIGR02300 family protein n=1 Tax=Benzoatithermus flavus TaxID=3108223 RepID=A0ABU8XVI9_9PROT
MAKPEWGTKRTCQSCGARFYDFGRSPIICPACGAVFDLEVLNRARRTRPAVRTATVAAEEEDTTPEDTELLESDAELEEEVEVEEDEVIAESEDEAQDEDEALIEDASELGEDEDMSDVIDSDIDEEPR